MANALIMHCGEPRTWDYTMFFAAAKFMNHYLKGATGIKPELLPADKSEGGEKFLESLSNLIDKDEPLLFAMIGHGNVGIMELTTPEDFLLYKDVAKVLTKATAPTLGIIDACHSYSFAQACIKQSVNKDKVGIIAACSAKQTIRMVELCTPYVLEKWLKKEFYPKIKRQPKNTRQIITEEHIRVGLKNKEPIIEVVSYQYSTVRWGLKADELFFPKSY